MVQRTRNALTEKHDMKTGHMRNTLQALTKTNLRVPLGAGSKASSCCS